MPTSVATLAKTSLGMDNDRECFVGTARALALRYHSGQKYGSRPYTDHLHHVVSVLQRFGVASPEAEAAGWLHDILEDTTATAEVLSAAGIPALVIAAVEAVTDEPGATRGERKAKTYPKIASSRFAVAVKLADRIANVEAGGKVTMYAKEYPAFRTALYNQAHGLDELWAYLDAALAKH